MQDELSKLLEVAMYREIACRPSTSRATLVFTMRREQQAMWSSTPEDECSRR